jgi:hypothetical protein
MAETVEAYWLIDLIASYQPDIAKGNKKVVKHDREDLKQMQFWTIDVRGNRAMVYCQADDNRSRAIEQRVEYTDFPEEIFKIWVGRDQRGFVIYLPSEY